MPGTKIAITFVKGARKVTGANILIEATKDGNTTRMLLDCGLTQGERFCESTNNDPFPYDPKSIDAVFISHAHADHIGLFPKLVKDGFTGNAYVTEPTKELIPIMLEDSVSLIGREAKTCNEEAPYVKEDVDRAVSQLQTLNLKESIKIADGITGTFYNAGHILGSAIVLLDIFGTKVLFTGDLGRTAAILLPDREVPEEKIDYLITESVYGGREHVPVEVSEKELQKAIEHVEKTRGTLLIPSFSLERTQIILSTIERFIKEKVIDPLPVFMDSPLATKVTEVYRNNKDYLREEYRERMEKGDDPFSFSDLKVSYTKEESDHIDEVPGPKIIIAGAGMSHGGRIRSHEKTYLPDPNSMLLLVGYQTPGSLGRRLQDGAKKVKIDNVEIPVRAQVRKTGGFSAHADRDDLLQFAEEVNPKQAFVVLGELDQSSFLAQRISGFLGIKSTIPQEGETYYLDTK